MSFTLAPIGIIRSCFTQKFGIPRQPGLARDAIGHLILSPPYNNPEAVVGLEAVSHLWVQFIFHEGYSGWKPRVKMPRLGGNKTLGVFATRSPNRPNNIGLSVVRLLKVEVTPEVVLTLGGIDFLDGTPVLDIKPYLPYADAIPDAHNDWASGAPELVAVQFSANADAQLNELELQYPGLRVLAEQVLAQDPRPSYQDYNTERVYVLRLWDLDVRWRFLVDPINWRIEVLSLEAV
ncbi:MAG TPA: tRNA (N6-threonylcarbamoyladenosine(37)-N6)-methyltransferase TrmO [Cellvibrionaceae bacterium]